MRWLAKALLQKTLSALPQGERANYLLQRHVTRSLPGAEAGFRRRFERATRHVEAYAEHGSVFERAGLTVVAERPWRPGVALPEDLDPRFRDYCPEDLAVLGLRLVAVPSPDALEEPENVVG
jgi:hypothetical protein